MPPAAQFCFAQAARLDRLGYTEIRVLDQPLSVDLVTYQIDDRDRIDEVSGSWPEFATANGGAPLATSVLGRSLWKFVSDETTRQVYRDLIARVRAGRTVSFSYRCDSPALRRFMRMTMSPGSNAAVIFNSVIVRTEPREPQLLTAPSIGADDLLRICGWCKRVAIDDTWVEIEVAVDRLGIMDEQPAAGITHGMCPECVTRVAAEADAA